VQRQVREGSPILLSTALAFAVTQKSRFYCSDCGRQAALVFLDVIKVRAKTDLHAELNSNLSMQGKTHVLRKHDYHHQATRYRELKPSYVVNASPVAT
jgi:hypothetical protein